MPASFLLISDSLQTQLVKMKGNFRILFTIHFVVFDAKQLKLFEVFHFSMSLLCSLSCCSLINLSSHFLSFSFSQFFILPSASPFFFFSCHLFAFILLLHRFTSAAGHQFSISFIFFIFLLASFSTLFLFFCLFSIFSHETAPPPHRDGHPLATLFDLYRGPLHNVRIERNDMRRRSFVPKQMARISFKCLFSFDFFISILDYFFEIIGAFSFEMLLDK